MRKRLMAAAAMAPLTLLGLTPASAQTTISNSQTTPQLTSASGDLTIASGGNVSLTASGNIVTLNSNNNVDNAGAIQSSNVDNIAGIFSSGGFTGNISSEGSITISESYAPTDSVNSDGVAEAPFAQGTGRYGIHLTGAPLTGSVVNNGSIGVQGNNSTAIAVDGGLNGGIADIGTINITGDHSLGIHTAGEITGGLQVNGGIAGRGLGVVGVQTTGQIDGALTFYSTVSTTGYSL